MNIINKSIQLKSSLLLGKRAQIDILLDLCANTRQELPIGHITIRRIKLYTCGALPKRTDRSKRAYRHIIKSNPIRRRRRGSEKVES